MFDHGIDPGLSPPFGFTVEGRFVEEAAGYLGILLRSCRPDGSAEWFLVNRGTRFETSSVIGLARALWQDMATNAGIQFGREAIPAVDAALAAAGGAVAIVRAAGESGRLLPLLLLGQSMGGGLAHIQAAADWQVERAAGTPRLRFVTFAASDAGRIVEQRFPRALPAPDTIGVNYVSARDSMTGPASLFGQPRLGLQHVVQDMRGPRFASLGLDFHRAGAWVNYCAGRRVDDAVPPLPRSADAWRNFTANCALPAGWP